jgi:DNA-binding CsgD family transcriptional regulator
MIAAQLVRVRWGVRAALFLGVATSVAANILHARPNIISQAIAAWPPLALLLTVELISRIPVQRRSLTGVRLSATATIAGIAAWVSYWHMTGVASRYGEVGAAPYLIPLSVDGLVVVASVCLVELAGRIRLMAAEPVTVADTPADIQADTATDTVRPAPKPARKRDTATAVARLRARHPDLSTRDIARRLGVTDRTVRRHLSTATT